VGSDASRNGSGTAGAELRCTSTSNNYQGWRRNLVLEFSIKWGSPDETDSIIKWGLLLPLVVGFNLPQVDIRITMHWW
jgi:hypothetical protein